MANNNTTATVETITPDTARQYLLLNHNNRPISKTRVLSYAGLIRDGLWLLSGEPIIFSNAQLLNGQHRLEACVMADTAFQTVVVRNVDNDSFQVMDSGMTRRVSDVLAGSGITNARTVASIANVVMTYSTGKMHKKVMGWPRQKVLAHVNQHLERYDNAFPVANRAKKHVLNPSSFGALAFFVYDHQRFDEYIDGVMTGENLSHGDPRLTLRTWMLKPGRPPQAAVIFTAIVKAWNAFVRNEQLAKIYAYTDAGLPTGLDFFKVSEVEDV